MAIAKRVLFCLLIVGILLRVGATVLLSPTTLVGDEIFYWGQSSEIIKSGIHQSTWQPPGFSYLLAGLRIVTGDSIEICRALGILVFIFSFISIRYLHRDNLKATLFILLLFTLHPVVIGFSPLLWNELPFLLVVILAITATNKERYGISGILWGIAILFRQSALFYCVFITAALLYKKEGSKRSLLILTVALAITVLPILVINYSNHGIFRLSSSNNFNLWASNYSTNGEPYGWHGAELGKLGKEYSTFGSTPKEREEEAGQRAKEFISEEMPQWLWKKPLNELPQLLAPENLILRNISRGLYPNISDTTLKTVGYISVVGEYIYLILIGFWLGATSRSRLKTGVLLSLSFSLLLHLFLGSHSRHRFRLSLLPLLCTTGKEELNTKRGAAIALIIALIIYLITLIPNGSSYSLFN